MKSSFFIAIFFIAFSAKGAEPRTRLEEFTRALKSEGVNIHSEILGWSGGEGVGGGDEVAFEFHQSLELSLSVIKNRSSELSQKILPLRLSEFAPSVRVYIVDDALNIRLKELIQSSVAINFPEEKVIIINRARWKAIHDKNLKSAIAFHEILSLVGMEGTGRYPLSAKYISLFFLQEESLDSELKNDAFRREKIQYPELSDREVLNRIAVYNARFEDKVSPPSELVCTFRSKRMDVRLALNSFAGEFVNTRLTIFRDYSTKLADAFSVAKMGLNAENFYFDVADKENKTSIRIVGSKDLRTHWSAQGAVLRGFGGGDYDKELGGSFELSCRQATEEVKYIRGFSEIISNNNSFTLELPSGLFKIHCWKDFCNVRFAATDLLTEGAKNKKTTWAIKNRDDYQTLRNVFGKLIVDNKVVGFGESGDAGHGKGHRTTHKTRLEIEFGLDGKTIQVNSFSEPL